MESTYGSPDLAITAWSDVSMSVCRGRPEYLRVYEALRGLREALSEHRQYVVQVMRCFMEYLNEVVGKVVEGAKVKAEAAVEKRDPVTQPHVYAAMVKGTRYKAPVNHWASSLHSATPSSSSLCTSSLANSRLPHQPIGGTGVHVHCYINESSPVISFEPPSTVTIQKGRDLRSFQLDSAGYYDKGLRDQLKAIEPFLRADGGWCCVSHVADESGAGQEQAIHSMYKMGCLMMERGQPVEVSALLSDGERYKDVFRCEGTGQKPGGTAMWEVLDGRFRGENLVKEVVRDAFTLRTRVGFVKAHRNSAKNCLLLCILTSATSTCCVLDLNTHSWKTRPNQPTPSQAVFDMLTSIRSCSDHHPLRNSRLITLLSPIYFPNHSKHFLVLSLGNSSNPITPESSALRSLFAASRVCGTQYIFRED